MAGYVDLHCHWVPGIDDGVRSADEGVELLRRLRAAGFEHVVATPHMRPGMFPNDRSSIEAAYQTMAARVAQETAMPSVGLGSEHYLDDEVFARLVRGEGIAYPGGHAILVELHADIFPLHLDERMRDLRRAGLRPVLAHPERYRKIWSDVSVLDDLLAVGVLLLLDVASLAGKYGSKPQKTAESLLREGYYYAACSDAHRPDDVASVQAGIERLGRLAGQEDASYLLSEGPRSILDGRLPS
jgi:protein-tyrosine phosphatase